MTIIATDALLLLIVDVKTIPWGLITNIGIGVTAVIVLVVIIVAVVKWELFWIFLCHNVNLIIVGLFNMLASIIAGKIEASCNADMWCEWASVEVYACV